jgi:hypothetical protein
LREVLPELDGAGKEAAVALDHFLIAPAPRPFAVDTQDEVEMIRQHRVSVDVDGKDLGQLGQLLDDPPLSVIEASLGDTIVAAEEGAAHAAADHVVVGGGLDVDLRVAGLRHAEKVADSLDRCQVSQSSIWVSRIPLLRRWRDERSIH